VLLHSIAFGNLKLIAPERARPHAGPHPRARLAAELGVDEGKLAEVADRLFAAGEDGLEGLASPPAYAARVLDAEDVARTIHCMGTSLLDWVQDLHARGLFAPDARVFGLTSEGNDLAWKGYAAVSAAKVALEAIARSIAMEFAPHGVRCNVLQPGVTETPALAAIPGSDRLKAHARLRNPFRRLTTPRDVANVVYLMCLDEAAWINGSVIRVDGGEHVAGSTT
jgi:NAD(P)-dependent dehydrogenase (short-subunit alcohol dehydrogenase family)